MSIESIEDAQKSWGLPPIEITSPLVQQGYDNTCAVRSQQIILHDFGIDASEEELAQLALENEWFSEGGTPMQHMGMILEAYGIDVNQVENANIFSLTSELAQGHRVMVAVNSSELWENQFPDQFADIFGGVPDHALIVAGIDTSDPENITVQLMDPGTGDIAKSYPLDQFINAWDDSGFYMVSTSEPAPPWAYGMENFGYADYLHIPDVGGVPYVEFERFHALAEQHNDEPEFLEQMTNGFFNLMQGNSSLPEFLGSLFGDDAPSPDDITLPEDIQDEIRTLASAEEGTGLLGESASESAWSGHYQGLSDLHTGWGDEDNAAWYADQASRMTEPDAGNFP